MPRLACPEEAHATLHLVQRGSARRACFSCAADRALYLDALRECSDEARCAIHAYALMGNHVHLLLTPDKDRGPARLMPAVAACYGRYLSEEYGHEHPVWEERYDATPVRARRHLLACMRYVEENPVHAGLAARPADWPWSSYRRNALGGHDPLVTPHPHYFSLGRTPGEREAAYAATFAAKALSFDGWPRTARSNATPGFLSPRRSSPSR
jgi:putative transposase